MNTSLKRLNSFNLGILNIVSQTNSDELKVNLLKSLCTLNWKIHPGKFSCDQIENNLINIGKNHISKYNSNLNNEKKVLHLATELYEIGGHTRLLEQYINVFEKFQNDVILTRQSKANTPNRILNNKSINCIMYLDAPGNEIERAQQLSRIWENYQFVILHIHPDDITPIIAFGIREHKNILFINHADHVFWLGKRISKLCINIRPVGLEISQELRGIENNLLIPIILNDKVLNGELNIEIPINEKLIFGTMTTLHKIIPNGEKNFIRDVYEILDLYKDSEFYLIGIEESELGLLGFQKNNNPRLHFFGRLENPNQILQKINIYLEGYPYNSLTSLYEAILNGVCPVLMYNPINYNCNLETDLSFNGILYHTIDKKAYLEHIDTLVKNAELRIRINKRLRERMSLYNSVSYARKVLFSANQIYHNTINREEINNLSQTTFDVDINIARMNNWAPMLFNFVNIETLKKLSFKSKLVLTILMMKLTKFKYSFKIFYQLVTTLK